LYSKQPKQHNNKYNNKIDFANFQSWLTENNVYCANSEIFKQLSEDEFISLVEKYTYEKVKETILILEIKKDVTSTYTELYKILNERLETNKLSEP
jgi:hypothetical protein